MPDKVIVDTATAGEAPLPIPGGRGGIFIRLLNLDPAAGMVATVNRLEPGAFIPAHYHKLGAESHYVISGDFIEAGVAYGPGTFLTHATGVVHGPHETRGGCEILTVQAAFVDPNAPDFHLAGN
jgi:anti-sigma factor ChrR (cupin superfamily)